MWIIHVIKSEGNPSRWDLEFKLRFRPRRVAGELWFGATSSGDTNWLMCILVCQQDQGCLLKFVPKCLQGPTVNCEGFYLKLNKPTALQQEPNRDCGWPHVMELNPPGLKMAASVPSHTIDCVLKQTFTKASLYRAQTGVNFLIKRRPSVRRCHPLKGACARSKRRAEVGLVFNTSLHHPSCERHLQKSALSPRYDPVTEPQICR